MKLKSFQILLLCICCLLFAGCSNLSTTGVNTQDLALVKNLHTETLQQTVDKLVQPMVETHHTPGVIVGILLPDQSMQFFGYGTTNQSSNIKPTADTLFAVGSLSKGFLAAIAAELVDEGVVSWNDTLQTLLPPGTVLSPDAQRITLLQLATHTSGLPRQPITPKTLQYFIEYLFDGESFYRHFDSDYIMDYLADFKADNPGQPRYSNIGYGLLGTVLELRTGQSVDTLLQNKIAKPLGLKCTGYDPETLPCNVTRAYGYAGDEPMFIPRGDAVPDWQFTPLMRGSAALHSTARDLLTFAAAHMGTKKHLNKVLAGNLQVRFPRAKEAAATAWVVDDLEDGPITYQIGIVAGYTSYIGIDTAHNTAVVVMQNSFNWDNTVGHKLLLALRSWTAQPNFSEILTPSF